MDASLYQLLRPINVLTYVGSLMRHPVTLSKPRLCAAIAAAAIVFVLFGAKQHNSLTAPTEHQH